jgi:hypothetical protein
MRKILQLLEEHYRSPVDTEFTVQIENISSSQPEVVVTLLQCRPQSHIKEIEARLPVNLSEKEIIFSTRRMAPRGRIEDIRYVVYVTPEGYYNLPTPSARAELGAAIGRLNKALADQRFICVGPGRWGTSNPDLGVHINYGDIYNTYALVELAGKGIGPAPEASFGTHFFQDLVESNIYPLAIYLDDPDVVFNRSFFYNTPNRLKEFLPGDSNLKDTLRLIEVSSCRRNHHLDLVMDDEEDARTVAFLVPN